MYLKIKCGREIRKCTVEAESISLADLLQKVVQLFPSLREQKPENVQLAYRDTDSDLICMSSDDELRTAVAQVQGDTLTLVVTGVIEAPAEDEEEEEVSLADLLHGGDLFGGLWGHGLPLNSLLEPSLFPFHLLHVGGLGRFHQPSLFEFPATFRDRVLRAREEELRQQRMYEEKMRQAQLERRKALLEQAKQMREERLKEINENRRKSQDLQRMSSKDGGKVKPAPPIPEFPAGWIVKPIGSWDPVIREGPGFYSATHGPYGYYAYQGSEDMDTDKSKEQEPEEPKSKEQEQEEPKKQEEPVKKEEQA